jgi:carbon-monoxide dehydrogenase large subunit
LINPTIVEGQIQGAVALGIGGAMLEELVHDSEGQPLATSYLDYLMPTATDVPAVSIDHLETLSPLNPLGFKGVGESGTLPVAAAVASAVEDALGRVDLRVTRVPLTPGRLDELLRRAP